ncbi:Rrf2 family transcriptional regulator [Clostridium sp.]|uniref:Rrf2 family transcriptional regulator n=1 Tax=Clostridium sp. TaxID=1506 RepID=UPI002844FEEC|nr:Rrf2 family transcriptional regulator [Clostridium sp.]MDR3595899.1 Rrf2 family transcriptional regulator [Clostridium sp.]
MKITQEPDCSLCVILYLLKLEYGEKIEAATIVEHEELPFRFLLKFLRKLITETKESPISVNRCIFDSTYCNARKGNKCEIHRALKRVHKIWFYNYKILILKV